MNSVSVITYMKDKSYDFMSLDNLDFDKNVAYLKDEIRDKLRLGDKKLEIVYNGTALEDSEMLANVLRNNATVHCFMKTKQYEIYKPSPNITTSENIAEVQNLFTTTSHCQISVSSRMNILQKVIAAYPEFRRNLGAQALIRDSVLFNTLHTPEVVKNIAKHYPIICEAAPFIVDTIKKELTRSAAVANNTSEPTTDSTNSSEEENSLTASSSSAAARRIQQSENARIRLITRQQLQSALSQISVRSSVNSLTNIAQRNAAPISNSTSGERISSELLRVELERALMALNNPDIPLATIATSTTTPTQTTTSIVTPGNPTQYMDTTESPITSTTNTISENVIASSDNNSGDTIPIRYRTNQYAEQLRTLAQMGFLNHEENLTYLGITNGNLENTVNLLMGSMN